MTKGEFLAYMTQGELDQFAALAAAGWVVTVVDDPRGMKLAIVPETSPGEALAALDILSEASMNAGQS